METIQTCRSLSLSSPTPKNAAAEAAEALEVVPKLVMQASVDRNVITSLSLGPFEL